MGVCCGIDLGTTYSAIAWYDADHHRAEAISLDHADGQQVIPSAVFFQPGGKIIVGEAARAAAQQYPDHVIVGIKRLMGEDYKTPPIDGRNYSPEEVSAKILQVLKADAQRYLGKPVTDVVISVPVYFDERQRAATLEAGRLAGFKVLELIPEPHAAVLAVAVDCRDAVVNRSVLVYDLGGGTFDVTLVRVSCDEPDADMSRWRTTTLAMEGNRYLGGQDWDSALARLAADRAMNQYDIADPYQDTRKVATLLRSCEAVKRLLSHANFASMEIEGHHIEISRSEFELQTADLVSQAETLVVRFLAEIEDIHDLLTERRIIELGLTQSGMRSASAEKGKIRALLCGGATRMPMVLESITRVMGEPPLQYRNPDLLVAEGAALRAHQLTHRMQRESPSRPIAPYNETGSTALSLQEFAMSLSMRESEPPPSFALVRVDSQSSPLLNLFSLLITNPGVVYQFEKQLADSASPARSQADLSLTTARLAHLRLDAAVPGRVVVNQVFELAVAVRKRTSSILAERDLTRVQSADVQLRWPAGRHHVTLRIHLSAPDCVIQGADSQSFELDADEDSPVCYFQLVPRKLGEINIVVRVYQSENTLGSARVQTVASEQAVGSMHLAVTSYPFAVSLPVPDHLAYDPVRLQAFLSAKVELPQFCFALERRLRRCYAYRDLKGSADSEKVMDLIQRADTNEELGKIIFHLIRFWIEDRNYSPQVLRKHGLHQDLNVFCFELQEQGDPDRMAVVADRLREILSR